MNCENNIYELDFVLTDVNELPIEQTSIHVYPNPVNEFIFFELDDARLQPTQIQLVDLHGKVVKTFNEKYTFSKGQLSVTGIPAGPYLLRMQLEDKGYGVNQQSSIYAKLVFIH